LLKKGQKRRTRTGGQPEDNQQLTSDTSSDYLEPDLELGVVFRTETESFYFIWFKEPDLSWNWIPGFILV
jgi:hypothetical protein